MPIIISRAEARASGLTKYFTGRPCKAGHLEPRYVSNGHCPSCVSQQSSEWSRNNREAKRQHGKTWYYANVEAERERSRQRRRDKPEACRAAVNRWFEQNPGRRNAYAAQRRARLLDASPSWLTQEHFRAIDQIYANCPAGWHVDHILPLQGKTVCGLHVPWNLRPLNQPSNNAKFNHLPDDPKDLIDYTAPYWSANASAIP